MGNNSSLPESHEVLPLPVWLEHDPSLKLKPRSSLSSVGTASVSSSLSSSMKEENHNLHSLSLDTSTKLSVENENKTVRSRRMSMPDDTSIAITRYLARSSSFKRSHTVHKRKSTRVYAASEPQKVHRFAEDARFKKVKFLDFKSLQGAGRFPAYKDDNWKNISEEQQRYLTISADKIDFENSFTVFISHCWLHGKNPKPDTDDHEQYQLCVKAIEYMWRNWASDMEQCFVWVDYSCINVERETAFKSVSIPNFEKEEFPLELVMSCCDCMLTPLLDPTECWSPPKNADLHNYVEDLHAAPWNIGPDAYLNRGWCRLEMLFCSNVPLLDNYSAENSRRSRFKDRLVNFINRGQRPHVLYSNYQMRKDKPPISFTPISSDDAISKYHPCAGCFSDSIDRPIVSRLFQEVQKHVRLQKVGYDGELNSNGEMHGQGTYRFQNGDVFTGTWKNGLQHGAGVRKYSNGDEITCEFSEGFECGLCTLNYASGDVYYGMLCDGKRFGRGIMEFSNGDVYEGFFKDDVIEGKGKMVFADGTIYEGDFLNGKRHGRGTMKCAEGMILFRGSWKDDQMQQRRKTM